MKPSSSVFGDLTIADLVDAVMALTVVEAAALVLLHRRRGSAANPGLAPREVGLNLLSGLCLMGALHFSLRGAGAIPIAGCLNAAGLAHGADLFRRSRRAAAGVDPVRPAGGTAAPDLAGR